MGTTTRFQKLLKGELERGRDEPEVIEIDTEHPVEKKTKVGKFFSGLPELYDRAINKSSNNIYRDAYYDDPDTMNQILGGDVTESDVDRSTKSFFKNVFGGIGGFIYRTAKTGDYKNKIEKTQSLYSNVYDVYDANKQKINMLEQEHIDGNLDDQQYRDGVFGLAKETLDLYNYNAEQSGLGKMTNFADMERGILKLDNIYQTKKIYDQERDELKEDTFKVFGDREVSDLNQSIIEERSLAYNDSLSKSLGKINNITNFKDRTFDGVALNNNTMVNATKDIYGALAKDYNQILDVRKTVQRVQDQNPDDDFSGSLERIDSLLVDAQKNHTLFMDTYVKNIGTEGWTTINDFTRSFEKETGRNVEGLFSDEKATFNMTDVRQAQILKDYVLVKRDIENMIDGDSPGGMLGLVVPLGIVDDKIKFKAPTMLSAVSLLRGSIVTPAAKNIATKINDITHLRQTTDFYNGGMNMLKSAAFNLDQSKDYNLVNFARKSAELAPDIAEFLIPMGQVVKVQNALWKGSMSATKAFKVARGSRALTFSEKLAGKVKLGSLGMKEINMLDKVNQTAAVKATKGFLHTMIDINIINAPFETRNPREYNAMDALFDVAFNAVEIGIKIGKSYGTAANVTRYADLKNDIRFQTDVYKEIALKQDGMTKGQADVFWDKMPTDEKIASLAYAKNYLELGERFDSISFMMGIDPIKYKGYQNAIKGIDVEAKLKWQARQTLTEAEMSEIVNKHIVGMDSPQLLQDWNDYYELIKTTQLNTRAVTPTGAIRKGSFMDRTIEKFQNKATEQEGFRDLSDRMRSVNDSLDKGIGDREKLLKERELYLGWLDYYAKMKHNLDTILKDNAADSLDGTKSKLLGENGYRPETTIKKLTEDKYSPIEAERSEQKYFVGLDNEMYPVSTRTYVHTTSGNRFMILKIDTPKGTIFHRQNFKKTGSDEFVSSRLFDDEMSALAKINDLEKAAVVLPVRKISMLTDYDIFKEYNKYMGTRKPDEAMSYINQITHIVPTRQGRVIYNISDKKVLGIEGVSDPAYNRFAHELSVKIRANPEDGIDMEVAMEIADRYGIKLGDDFEDLLHGHQELNNFAKLTNDYINIDNSIRSKQTIDNVTNAEESFAKLKDLKSYAKPRVINQTKKSQKQLVGERTARREVAAIQGNKAEIEVANRNIETLGRIAYDYGDLSKIENKAKGFWYGPLKFFNRFTKNTLTQGKDLIPTKTQAGFLEFQRLNANYYTIGPDSKQLMEIIPVKGTYKYTELVGNLKKGLDKETAQASLKNVDEVTEKYILTEAEKEATGIWKVAQQYYNDMVHHCKSTFGENIYTANKITNYNEWLDIIRQSNANESMFYFVAKTDDNLYKMMTDPKRGNDYFATFGSPTTISGSPEIIINKINEVVTDLARMGKGNSAIRFLGKVGIGPEFARRVWNFTTGGAYILGTTVLNPTLLMSQLFLNGSGLITDGIYRGFRGKQFRRGTAEGFWKAGEVENVMKKYGILYDVTDAIPLLPKTTGIMGMWRHFSNPRVVKKITDFGKNVTNAGLYNFTEMAFDKAFKTQRVLETLIADRGLKNIDEMNDYLKFMNVEQQQKFISTINEAANRRYVMKTGNSFSSLEKFYHGHTKHFGGVLTKQFMRSISLLANWGYTHVRSLSDLLTNHKMNRIALNNFNTGRGTLRESKKLVENLLNNNYDYEMLMNKIFFTMNVGRKIDRISDNDIEEDTAISKLSDSADYAKYLYAPFGGLESTPIYRMISQTIGTAILAGKHEELNLDVAAAAGTALLSRVLGEMKRRATAVSAVTQGISITVNDPNIEGLREGFAQTFAAWKQSTAGFGYFIDKDLNYYGYQPDMPYSPQPEIGLFMPERNKNKEKFMRMNTLKQLAELQKTDKSYKDYFQYRVPVWKDILIGRFGKITEEDEVRGIANIKNIAKIRANGDRMNNTDAVNAYVLNTDKRWNELNEGTLNLNNDLEAGQYIYNLLSEHAVQPFTDKRQYEGTKMFMNDFVKKYMFKGSGGDMIPLAGLNNKEQLWMNNMFKLADQGKISTYFSEFTKADNNDQKKGLWLLAFVEAQMEANGEGENVPGAHREMISSLAYDMYNSLANQVKKERGYPFEPGKYLDSYDPQADAEIKYYIASQLGDTLFDTDKESRASVGRYFARDQALRDGDSVANLFSSKYSVDDDGNKKLKYGDVDVKREKGYEEGKDSKNIQGTHFNNLFLLTNILAAEGKLTGDKMYVGFSSILPPKKQRETYEPAYVYNTMAMAKILSETIDDSVLSIQDKASSKAGLFSALLPYLSKITGEVIEEIGEERFWQMQDRVYGASKDVFQLVANIGQKEMQDGEYSPPTEKTGTLLDMYNSNGNYKNTYWSSDPYGTYGSNNKYYDTISRYYRNNYAKIPTTYIKLSSNYGKTSYYKNLYLKFADAKSQNIPGGRGKGSGTTTAFTLKGGKKITLKPVWTEPTTPGVVGLRGDDGLITESVRNVKYPEINNTYIDTGGR